MGHLVSEAAERHLDVKYPVLDHGFVSLIDYMGTDQRIAEAAWVSSLDEVEAEKRTEAARQGIINYMMKHHHSSPFEQVELVFRVRLPIFVARQWVRHRTASINEMSGRYRILPAEAYLPGQDRLGGKGTHNKQGTEGELKNKTEILTQIEHDQAAAFVNYGWYDQMGLANELARINLPLATYTEWYWKINLHNLFRFLSLRLDTHAQWEIRQYAEVMFKIVKDLVPMAAAAFEEHVLESVTFSRAESYLLVRYINSFGPVLDNLSTIRNLAESSPEDGRLTERQISEFASKLIRLSERALHTLPGE